MSETVKTSLEKAAKGTALVFLGSAFSLVLWLVTKIILVRIVTTEEFGEYTLAVTVASIIAALAPLGVQFGATRYIPVFVGQGLRENADSISRAALKVGIVSSIVTFTLLFIYSDYLAQHIFYKPYLAPAFRAVFPIIPFTVMTVILINILRGRGIIAPKFLYQDIGQPTCFLIALSGALLFDYSLIDILIAFVISTAVVFFFIAVHGYRKIRLNPISMKKGGKYRELLSYSLPMILASVSSMILSWTDTLMLGRYSEVAAVGIYNIGLTLARLLSFPLASLTFILMPLAGEMFGRGQTAELKRTYQVTTKWLFSATLPLFLVLVLVPETVIALLFGNGMVSAATPLRILSCAYLFTTFLGSNGVMLEVLGHPKTILYVGFMGGIINVILNYLFIKVLGYGASGAAAATMIAFFFIDVVFSMTLYKYSRIHPFTSAYIKPLTGAAILGLLIIVAARNLPFYVWVVPIYFVIFVAGYVLSMFLTRSFDNEDIAMLEAISKKTGVRLDAIVKLLNKFALRNP